MLKLKRIILLTLFVTSFPAYSEVHFGIGASTGTYSVEDPKGATDSDNTTSVFGVLTMPVDRNYPLWRYWFELNHRSFEVDASQTKIGQKVKSTNINAMIQRGFNVSTQLRPWFGFGVGAGLNDYEDRYTIDQDGYLKDLYDDRSATDITGLLNVGLATRKLDAGFSLGTSLTYEIPLTDGIKGTTLNVFIMF